MKILLTGATGHFGGKVVEALLKKVSADKIAVSVRNPEKAKHLADQGIEVRQGDFDKPETLDSAFKGVDRLLIVSTNGDNETRIRQHKNAVEAAKRTGVKYIAYTSVANAAESELFLAIVHKTTEEAIKATGIPYTFLRNNWYLENEKSSIKSALAGAPWLTSAKTGKVGWALRQEYAEAAATALAEQGHENKIYELSGKPLSQEEIVKIVEKLSGKNIEIKYVNDEEYTEIIKGAGVPEAIIPMLVSIQQDIRKGTLDVESDDFTKLLGRPATSVEDGIKLLFDFN